MEPDSAPSSSPSDGDGAPQQRDGSVTPLVRAIGSLLDDPLQ